MRITLDKPLGFLPATHFRGFEQPSTGSAIAIVELTAPRDVILAGMTSELLMTQGFEVLDEESPSDANGPLRLLIARQFDEEDVYFKWISISGDETSTVLVTASCPERHAESMAAILRNAALSARCYADDSATTAPASPVKELAYAGCAGDVAVYTEDGQLPQKTPDAACFMLAYVPRVAAVPIQAIAEQLFARNARLRAVRLQSGGPVQVDGLPGWELRATAHHTSADVPLFAYLCVLEAPNHLIVLQGSAGAERRAMFEPIFIRFARGYRQHNPATMA